MKKENKMKGIFTTASITILSVVIAVPVLAVSYSDLNAKTDVKTIKKINPYARYNGACSQFIRKLNIEQLEKYEKIHEQHFQKMLPYYNQERDINIELNELKILENTTRNESLAQEESLLTKIQKLDAVIRKLEEKFRLEVEAEFGIKLGVTKHGKGLGSSCGYAGPMPSRRNQ